MSHYSVFQVIHDTNYFEIFTVILQIGLDRANSSKVIQQKLQQSEQVKSASEIITFVNNNERALQSYVRQEKQRIERELTLIEMLVNKRNTNQQHIMAFYHLSLKIINQWYPNFAVRNGLSGELQDLADLYGSFFLMNGMSHRHQQVQTIKKSNLYDKVPFVSLLMKWLSEFCRVQFTKLFTQLNESLNNLKATYASIKQPQQDVLLSPKIQKIQQIRPQSTKILTKARSQSSYTHSRKTSQMFRKQTGIINRNITNKDFKNYLQPILDILDIELSHSEQGFYLQKKLLLPSRIHEQAQTHQSLYNLLLQRNQQIQKTRDNYYQQAHSQANQQMKIFTYSTPQQKRLKVRDTFIVKEGSFFT